MKHSYFCSVRLLFPVTIYSFFSEPGVTLGQGTINFLPPGSAWHYLADGSDQGTAWRLNGFNDTAWLVGSAPLGYGRTDLATLIGFGPDPANKPISSYFRNTFTATNVAALYSAVLRVRRDDGCVAFLNGAEVFRSNMPTGFVNNVTWALGAAVGPDETTFFETNIDPALLIEGTNVLAVEVHQVGPASPDLAFDLELLGLQPYPSTVVSAAVGYSTFANNYNRGGNTLNELIPFAADGTLVVKWDTKAQTYNIDVYDALSAEWLPNTTLVPGEGALVYSPIPQVFVFSGDIPKHPFPQDSRSPGLRLVSCALSIT